MSHGIDETAWLTAMRNAAIPAIRLAAEQMGDPAAAAEWTESQHTVSFVHPASTRADISYSRPDAGGEMPGTGVDAMSFDYLRYVAGTSRANPLLDRRVRDAVLRQIRGRARDAEIARVSPGSTNPAWACRIDVLTWCALSHLLSPDEIETLVSLVPSEANSDVSGAVGRQWQPPGSTGPGPISCFLVPDNGTIAVDGFDFRLGPEGSRRIRIESSPANDMIVLCIDGINLPETATRGAIGSPLSRLVDDPILRPASEILTVRSFDNHDLKSGIAVEIRCDYVAVRCAPMPAGARFAWEDVRDAAAGIPRRIRTIGHGDMAWRNGPAGRKRRGA